MLIVDHANRAQEPESVDPPGWYVEVKASTFFPKESVVDLIVHTRIATNRPGSDAFAPLNAVEALALADVLREYALQALRKS